MALGVASSVNVMKESVYGTNPAAASYNIPFSSEGFQLTINRARSNNIVSGASYASVYDAGKYVEWSLSGDCLYNRLDHLILGVMGTVATTEDTGPAGAEVGCHTNLYTPSTTLPSFTFEVSKGNIPASGIFEYVGCMVSRLEIAGDDTGALRFTASGFGKDETSAASTGDTVTAVVAQTATYLTDPILVQKATIWDVGTGASTAYCVKSFRLVIDRKLQPNDFCWGSSTPGQPQIEDFMEVTGEFTIKFIDRLAYDDFDAQTDLAGNVKFVSANEVVAAGTANYRTLDILLNNFRYDSPGGVPLVDTPGLLVARLPFTAYGTGGSAGTSQPLSITTINNVDADSL